MRSLLSIRPRCTKNPAIMNSSCFSQLELNGLAAASEARNGGAHPTDQTNKIGLAGSNPPMKTATHKGTTIVNALPDGDSFFLLPEVAGALRVSVKTVRRLIDEGKLKTHKIRGRILVRRSELMKLVTATSR
jgi:excisionase family DNA binding protein